MSGKPAFTKKPAAFSLPRQPWVDAEKYALRLDEAKARAEAALLAAGVAKEDLPFRLPNYGRLEKLFDCTPPVRKGGPGDSVSYGNAVVTLDGVSGEANIFFKGQRFSFPPRADRTKKPTFCFRRGPGGGTPLFRVAEHLDRLFKMIVAERTWWCRSFKGRIVDGVGRQPKTAAEIADELLPAFYERFPYYSSDPEAPNHFNPREHSTCYVTNEDWAAIRRAWSSASEQEAICPKSAPIFLKTAKVPNLVQTTIQAGDDAGKELEDPIFRAVVRVLTSKDDRDRVQETGVDAVFSDRRYPVTATTFRNIPVTPENIDTHEDIRSGVAAGLLSFSFCVSTLAVSLPVQLKLLITTPDASSAAAAEAAFGNLLLTEEEKAENLAAIERLGAEASRAGGPSGGAGGPSGAGAGAGAGGPSGGAGCRAGDSELGDDLGADELAELAGLVA